MSGPKGGSYRVVSAEELARRRLAAAESAQRGAAALVADAQNRCAEAAAAYGLVDFVVQAPTVPPPGDAEAIEHWVEAARQAVRDAEAALAEGIVAARQAWVAGAITEMAGSLEVVERTASPQSSATYAATEVVSSDAWRADVTESVERSLASLDSQCTTSEAEALQALAADALAARSKVQGRQLADLLGNDVGRAHRAAATRRDRAQHLRTCLVELDAWDHPATIAAAAWITAAAADNSVEAIDLRVSEAIAEAAAECDRVLVAEAVRRSLQALGYVVEEGFETMVVNEGVAYVRSAGWSDHAVRVRLYEGRQRVSFNVVARTEGHDKVRDAEIEREWCGDVKAMTTALGDQGVELELTELTPAGTVPVQVLADDVFPFDRQAAARRNVSAGKREQGL